MNNQRSKDSKFDTTEPAVAVTGVSKIFRNSFRKPHVRAVHNLSLRVAQGQVFGLLGPNGSGKSTALRLILGLIAPTSGSVEIFGRSNTNVRTRTNVGFLPENPYFYQFLTGRETLRFYGKLSGL